MARRLQVHYLIVLPGQSYHLVWAILAHEYIHFEVNRVGAGLACAIAAGTGEAGWVHTKSGEDFRTDSDIAEDNLFFEGYDYMVAEGGTQEMLAGEGQNQDCLLSYSDR
jgi:hypothetical protein